PRTGPPRHQGRYVQAQEFFSCYFCSSTNLCRLWAFQKLINNFSFHIRQLFAPFLEFLRCLSHPICYFANDSQWCLTAIRACWVAGEFFVCHVRVIFKAPCWF